MKVHLKGFVVLTAFAAVLAIASDSRLGILFVIAAVTVEVVMWTGVAGLWRARDRANRS
jgi:hypothetical protein